MPRLFARGKRWRLYGCDARTALEKLPDNSMDALITDPPYSSGGKFRGDRAQPTTSKYQNTKNRNLYAAEFAGDNRDQRSFRIWCERWLKETLRVLKPGAPIVLFCDWRQLPVVTDEIQVAGLVWRGISVWDKTEGCRPNKGAFRQQAEFIVWGTKGPRPKPSDDAPCLPGVFRCAPLKGGKNHVAGKPLELMSAIVEICPPGGTVLDLFTGGGATGVASLKSGRRFVGMEMVPEYFHISADSFRSVQ